MKVNRIEQQNFGAFKYTRKPISELCRENLHSCYKAIEEKFPDVNFKKVLEGSPFLSSLAKDTDVFVNSHMVKYEDHHLGIFKAVFKDPYDKTKKYADEISIRDEFTDQADWMQKLKTHLAKLPENYPTLKKETNVFCGIRMLRDNIQSSYGYIIEGYLK